MTRPGLIVGLGGTGQWVLTWLKRDLMLSNNGKMPPNVKLLAIDTCAQLEAKASRVTANGRNEEAVEVGDVMLDRSEYVYLGGSAHDFAREIAEKQRQGPDDVYGWFHARKWLATLNPRTFIIDEGAGRLRQFGRLAIFKDIRGGQTGSKLWGALRSAIQAVESARTPESPSMEIVVVGSFAGGTGSGLFIDVALILRLLTALEKVDSTLRGVFALPGVFTHNPDPEMKARSFAAWRELNRFMVVNEEFPMPEIRYVAHDPQFRIRPDKRIFDACYLVDGTRRGDPLSQEAKYGVFPMLAEAISAWLDEEAGTAYTQWVTINLASAYARHPELPMYSAVGAYTIQVPAYFVQEKSALAYSKTVMLKLLSPTRNPEEDGRWIALGAERHLALAAPDRNQEDRGFAGRQRCLTLLQSSIEYGIRRGKPTLFHSRIASIIQEAIDQGRRQSLIDTLAKGGVGASSWSAYFPDLGDDPTFEKLKRNVKDQMNYNLVESYRRREGEKEEEARARLAKIPEDVRTRYGGFTTSGEEIEEFYGTCGEVLKACEQAQLTIFRQLVQLKLLEILNGHSDDALVAKSGKVGYAWDYFDGLVKELERFLSLMNEVKRRREELKPELKYAGLSKKAQDSLHSTSGKKIFWIIEPPSVKRAELDYLNAQQRLMEIRREDILHHFVVETVMEMKAICEEVRDTLQSWIWHLATGDSASHMQGLWEGIRAEERKLDDAHSFDRRADKVQKLVAEAPASISEQDVREALRLWEWEPLFEQGRFELKARIKWGIVEETPAELSNPVIGQTPEMRQAIEKANLETLLAWGRRSFIGLAVRTTVADAIKREYPDPKTFAEAIAVVSAAPLFEGGGECEMSSNYIRVQVDANDPYFIGADGLKGHLRALYPNHSIEVVGSENPFKLTFLRTDDLYPYDAYGAWRTCMEAYVAHVRGMDFELDPVLMHNFRAEIEAVQVEKQIVRELRRDYRSLHPRVVILLEDRTALEQFVFLFMLGAIKETTTPPYRWELSWMRGKEKETIWLTRGVNQKAELSLLQAFHGYVVLKHSREPYASERKVDVEFAQRFIDKERERLGPVTWRKLLRDHLSSPNGLVAMLKRIGYDYKNDMPDRVAQQDYADLALVVELFLQHELRELEHIEPEFRTPVRSLHPRIALLKDDEKLFEQCVYLLMFKRIRDVAENPDVYRWELRIPGRRGEQVFWLTPPWTRGTSRGAPTPTLLDALEGYMFAKHTFQPDRSDRIDPDLVQEFIEKQLEELGTEGHKALLERHLSGEKGLVALVRSLGLDKRRGGGLQKEYTDLAQVIEDLLSRRLEELEEPVPETIFGEWGVSVESESHVEAEEDRTVPPSVMDDLEE